MKLLKIYKDLAFKKSSEKKGKEMLKAKISIKYLEGFRKNQK